MKKIFLLITLVVSFMANAQELRCNITVNHQQVQGTNQQVFDALKKSVENLMNNTRWTDMTFKEEEKIDCSLGIIVKKYEDNIMTCEMQVQARRPVWGSNYNTPLFNFRDISVAFAYREFDDMTITPDYKNNLVALLAYYAYVIIGYDLDSFQKLGGSGAFAQAENIVTVSQSRSEPENTGWKAFEKNGKRYELISNLLDERFRKFREYFYDYHRLGLDMMSTNVVNARAKIADGLQSLMDVNRLQPQAQAIVVFVDTKKDEIVSVFAKHGTSDEIAKVYDIMTAVNPTSVNIYDKLKEK